MESMGIVIVSVAAPSMATPPTVVRPSLRKLLAGPAHVRPINHHEDCVFMASPTKGTSLIFCFWNKSPN